MPSPRRNKERLQEIAKELSTIEAETRKAVSDIHGEISVLKERIAKLHKRRWRTYAGLLINGVTIASLIVGLCFQVWLNRPVVDYQLTALGYTYSLTPVPQFNAPAQAFYFVAQNTGQTDITLDVTIAAINCTVSATEKGPFGSTATQRMFIQARSSWAPWTFYVKVNEGAPSFAVNFSSHQWVNSPDYITTQVDTWTTYNAINSQALTWVRDPSYPSLYYLQT